MFDMVAPCGVCKQTPAAFHYNQLVPPFLLREHVFGNALCTLMECRDIGLIEDTIEIGGVTTDGKIWYKIPRSLQSLVPPDGIIPFTAYEPYARFVLFDPFGCPPPLKTTKWKPDVSYNPLSFVSENETIYVSQTYVPPYTKIDDRNYWRIWRKKEGRE